MDLMNNVWRNKELKRYLTIRIAENLSNGSCGGDVCSRVDSDL